MTTAAPKRTASTTGRTKPRVSERELQMAVQDQDARVPEEERAHEDNDGTKAPLCGKFFKVDTEQGLMPLMEWAAANDSADPQNGPQLAALFYMLRDIVHPDDWDAFRAHAKEKKAKGPEFVKFQEAAAEVIAAVPTEQPETS